MLATSNLNSISKSYDRFGTLQEQLTSGKKIDRPSDDPVAATKGMFYRSNVEEVGQYKRNLSELYVWMENSETGLDQTNSALQRVRELVIHGKNGTNSPSDQKAVAAEIGQLKEAVAALANTKVAGKYIFNGTYIDQPPIGMTEAPKLTLDFHSDSYEIPVSDGVKIKANIDPTNIFNEGLFGTLENIENKLNGEDSEGKSFDDLLNELDQHLEAISNERAELGARYNRLEMVDSRLSHQEIVANKILSSNEDIDFEKIIVDLKTQESVHRAALSMGARIIQPTLMDFLR